MPARPVPMSAETTVRRPQPMRQVVLEPLDPAPRLQHLMGDIALGPACQGRAGDHEPGRPRPTAVRMDADAQPR
jgi:hypothetical protein